MKDWRRWNVAVTGMNCRPDNPGPGYAVARCLRESFNFRGRLIGFGYDSLDPGLHHREVLDSGYLLPYPAQGEEALVARLLEIHRYEPLDAVIPCLDAELMSFLRAAPALRAEGIRTLLPREEMIRARAKDRLPGLCARIGLSTPETVNISDPGFFDNCEQRGWSYPLVVKGIFYDASIVRNRQEAAVAFSRLVGQWGYPILVQRFLGGNEFNLSALGDGRGGMLGPVAMRKRALTEKGKAWAGVAVLDKALEEMAATLIRELKWIGPLEVEAMRTSDGRLHLIEINPRFPAWIYLSHGVRRNLPETLLRLMAEEGIPAFPPIQAGTMFVRYAQELIVSLESFESILMQGCSLDPLSAPEPQQPPPSPRRRRPRRDDPKPIHGGVV